MDPVALLDEILHQSTQLAEACRNQDRVDVLTVLDTIEENVGNFAEWIRKGGFIPNPPA